MHRLLWIAAAVPFWFVATVTIGQAAEKAGDAQLVSARGQVVDPDGKPVAGARVVLREWSSIRNSDDVYQKNVRDILAETKTDAEGRFEFVDVTSPPFRAYRDHKPWDVVAIGEGYAPGWIHLKDARDDRDLAVKLSAAKTIGGRLVDADGKPVAECKVQVASFAPPGSEWHFDSANPAHLDLWRSQLAPRATTDKDGRFEISGLPAEKRLTLVAEHPEFASAHFYVATTNEPQSPIEQPAFGRDGNQEIKRQPIHASDFTQSLERGRRLQGRIVFGDTGKPVPGARVSATRQNRAYFAVADRDGKFELIVQAEPTYSVYSSTDEPGYLGTREEVTFSDGQWQQEVELRLPRGEMVRGSVVDDQTGAGVAGVGVRYLPADYDEQNPWSPARGATTDAAGRFEISVPAGPGEVHVYDGTERHPTHDVPDHWRWRNKQALSPEHSATIDIVAGDTTGDVELKVGRGLVIRGHVVDADGEPVFAAEVHAADRFGRKERGKRSVTDEDGRFELDGLSPVEEWQIAVIDTVSQLRGGATVAGDEAAGASRVVDLETIALSGTGTVVGTVLGDGKPLAGARVSLYSLIPQPNGQSIGRTQQRTETDDAGRYEFDSVDTSEKFHLYIECDGYTSQGSTTYSISPGQVIEIPAIEIKSRVAFVAGIVVDPDGKPVAGVTVSASERDSYSSISYGRGGPPPLTGPDGQFRLEELPNVPLTLMAYIRAPEPVKDRSIHFPARVNAEPNQTDVRILLDPKLQRPLP